MPPIPAGSKDRGGFFSRVAASRAAAPKQFKFTVNPQAAGSGIGYQRNIITAQEMEENFESHEDGGKSFRFGLFICVMIGCLLLALMKYDVEYNVVPLLEGKAGEDAPATSSEIVDPVAAKYYEMLKVRVDKDKDEANMNEREKRRERWRLRQAAKKSYEGFEKDITGLTHCGRSCEASQKQMQLAYHAVNAKIDRDLYKVIGVDKKEALDRDKLRKKYEEMKSKIAEDKELVENDEDKEIALAELSDALEILSTSETRAYYNLYGERPPEEMKKTTARHGGWGQEFAFARSVHMKIAMQILNYFDSWYMDLGILVACLLFVGLAMWAKYPELMELVERLEAHEQKMKEMAEREKQQ